VRMRMDDAVQERAPIADVLKRLKLPDCPDGFRPDGFEPNGAWGEATSELKAAGVDDSGPRKALAELRRIAWAVFLVGGGLSQARTQIQRLQNARAEAQARRARLKSEHAHSRLIEEAEGEIEAVDGSIAALTPIVEAGSQWSGKDNRVLYQDLLAAQGKVDEPAARIAPYRAARLPFPEEWENSLFQAQKELSAATSAFAAGRECLDALSLAARETRERAYQAMRTALANVAMLDGKTAKAAIEAGDVDFQSAFPNRASDEIVTHHAHAERVAGIIERLGGGPHLGLAAFWKGAGPAEEIIRGKVRTGRSFSRPVDKGDPLPSHAQVLGEVF
jgi:cob(I)alamin adenosyltransferase